ncbi:uncharacterized protein LOC123529780 isoform X5 [Mercenaria mercenaria]|uniref:uncharacterized protein LOC123529780 isoform X5 n=1 Tax=Mercenaria mercenaria TaxID=6596 RepID=UPI00234F2EBA|nr:uncharacterized protein LOC123529780 isoform X5 [Mercenaria mercenaria]
MCIYQSLMKYDFIGLFRHLICFIWTLRGGVRGTMSRPQKNRTTGGGMWRKKQQRTDEQEGLVLDNLGGDRHSLTLTESVTLAAELGEATSSDNFQKEVAHKTNTLLIGRQEAETEVFMDVLVRRKGDVDKALLFVISTMKIDSKISVLVNNLINRGASTSTADSELKTPLHHAVRRNLKGVAAKLLEKDAFPHARDKHGTLPLKIAMDNKNDDMCALLLAYMPNAFVRGLFISCGRKVAEFSIHDLLRIETSMQKTILSILDCLIETRGSTDRLRVYYDLLECDEDGRTPTDSNFFEKSRSPLQVIAKKRNKNIVYHDAVRLLIRRKWKLYAKKRFQFNSFLYILGLFCITYSVIVAVMSPDPALYNGPLQISRAVFEVLSLVMVAQTVCTEINQLRRTFWGILFVGVRSLTEAQPVVDYTGEDGYGAVSVIFMVCFLFTCIVILLNILIAQLSDTYQKVQQDAQRGLEVNRAWIVAKVELNSFFFGKDFRTSRYAEYEDIEDLKDVLTKWDSPPLNEMNKYVKDIWDTLDNHKMNLLTIQHRLVRQENTLRTIQDQLRFLISLNTTGSYDTLDAGLLSSQRMKFYRNNTDENGPVQTDDTVDISTRRKHSHKEKKISLDGVKAVLNFTDKDDNELNKTDSLEADENNQ